jgi:hypothetical protein
VNRLEWTFVVALQIAASCGGGGGRKVAPDGSSATGGSTIVSPASGGSYATDASPVGGAGGTLAAGGATSDSGVSTSGDGATLACAYPSCIATLVEDCIPEGACISQSAYYCGTGVCSQPFTSPPTSMIVNACYANGVRLILTLDPSSSSPSTTSVATYKRRDGSVCYTLGKAGDGSTATVIQDATGAIAATLTTDASDSSNIAITCSDGTSAVLPAACLQPRSSGACAAGECQ